MKILKSIAAVLTSVVIMSTTVMSASAATVTTKVTDKNETLKVAEVNKGDYYPGVEYRFDLTFNGKQVDRTTMGKYTDKVTTSTNKKYIEYAKVKKGSDGTYDLFIKPVNKKYSDSEDLEFTVTFTEKTNKSKVYAATLDITVAFDEVERISTETLNLTEDSSRVLNFDEDMEYCEIYFDDIASYDANVTKTTKVDLRYNTEEIAAIVEKNPSAYLSFLSFEVNPKFRYSGTLYFYTKKDYLYSYSPSSGLKLLEDDNDSDIIAVQTATLGTYVLSDEPLKVDVVTTPDKDKPTDTSSDGVSVSESGGRINISKEVIEKKQFAGSSYILNCRTGDYITPADVDTMNSYLGDKGIAFRILNSAGGTLSQMIIKPYASRNVKSDIKIGANFNCSETLALFRHWFKNDIVGFHMEHYGAIGTPVEMALKLNYTGMDKSNLVAYVYYPQSNTYERLFNPNISIDDAGFTHITTVAGGDILISDGVLTDK